MFPVSKLLVDGQAGIAKKAISQAQSSGRINDFDPSGFSYVRHTGATADFDLTGIVAPASEFQGGLLVLNFMSGYTTKICHQNANSSAANRIVTPYGSDVRLPTKSTAVFIYDDTESRWMLVSPNRAPRMLYSDYTSRGYFTSGEQDLATFTIPAGTMSADGDRIRFRSNIVTAINDNYKSIAAKFNGNSLIGVGANFNDERFVVEGEIVRNGTSEARANTTFVSVLGSQYSFSQSTDMGSLDFTSSIVTKMTGIGSANLDISQRSFTIEFWPTP